MARDRDSLTDEELERQIEAAPRESSITDPDEPRATSARYDRRKRRIEIELRDGWMFGVPADAVQGLDCATDEEREGLQVVGDGYALHWDAIDVHYTVAGLLAGRLGSRIWMREHARRAGATTSEAKSRAARRNGLKGGRPPGSGESKTRG